MALWIFNDYKTEIDVIMMYDVYLTIENALEMYLYK